MKLSCKKLPPSLAENLKDSSEKRTQRRQLSFTQGIGWVWALSRGVRGTKTIQPACAETRAIRELNKCGENYGICNNLEQKRWAWETPSKAEGLEKVWRNLQDSLR